MITLITGVPGSGKTLYTIWYVKNEIEKENKDKEPHMQRKIYQNGVNGLTLDWEVLEDAKQWMDCPVGSVIVIDECQTVFRPRGAGTNVPSYIAALETHRHRGIDLYLITQHPMLVDQNIRRLVGRHIHVVRKFGMPRAVVHEWGSTHEITQRNLSQAQQRQFPYPKEVFSYYKSAELHTHKAKIPFKVWFLLVSPLLIAALVWFAWAKMSAVGDTVAKPANPSLSSASSSAQQTQQARPGSGLTAEAYILAMTPRLPGMPWTAPAYDEVTQPAEAPYPVACIDGVKGCRCYDQQQARIAVTETFCRDYLERGMFVPWKQQTAKAGEIRDTEDRKQARRADTSFAGG